MKFDYLKDWKKRAYERSKGRGKGLSFMLEEPTGDNDLLLDMHIHSDFSDGHRTVKQIGQQAQNKGIKKLEITDHDTIRPFNEIKTSHTALGHYEGDIINGVEVTAKLGKDIVHIKVEDFDLEKANELINTEKFRFLNRKFKIRKFIYLLSQRLKIINNLHLTEKPLSLNDFIKIEITSEKLLFLSDAGIDLESQILESLSKQKLIEEIKYKGKEFNLNFDNFNSRLFNLLNESAQGKTFLENIAKEKNEKNINFSFFNKYFILDKDSPLYVDDEKFYPTVEEVCDFAKKADGVAVFAHPFGYDHLSVSPEQLMMQAYKAGVDGMECMHGFNEPEEVEKVYKYCYEKGLLISAGSDLHRYNTEQFELEEVGVIPTKGTKSKHINNPMRGVDLGTYNVHYFGSGAWRNEKEFDIDSNFQLEK